MLGVGVCLPAALGDGCSKPIALASNSHISCVPGAGLRSGEAASCCASSENKGEPDWRPVSINERHISTSQPPAKTSVRTGHPTQGIWLQHRIPLSHCLSLSHSLSPSPSHPSFSSLSIIFFSSPPPPPPPPSISMSIVMY